MAKEYEYSLEEQRLRDTIADIGAEFNVIPLADMPTVQENFFVSVFLPMFAGDENRMYEATNGMWLNISHSPFNEVRVVNANGQEIFRVPPLLDQSIIKPLDGSGAGGSMPTITDMLTRARMLGRQGIHAMNRYMKDELTRRNFIVDDKGDPTIATRWNDIFRRYGRIPDTTVEAGKTTGALPVGIDSTEFDPL